MVIIKFKVDVYYISKYIHIVYIYLPDKKLYSKLK